MSLSRNISREKIMLNKSDNNINKILMQNFYSSSRSAAEYNKYVIPRYDANYKHNYPQFTHSRRKTEYDSRDYDLMNENQYLLQRSAIYQQLHEEKLYNQRSRLIIEDLLESNKRKKNLVDDIVINKMNPKQNSKSNLLQDRKYLEDRPIQYAETQSKGSPVKNYRAIEPYSREKDKNRYQPIQIKNKNVTPVPVQPKASNQKDITKSIILKKLYEEPQKKINEKPSPTKKNEQQQNNEGQALEEQIQFLKQQLNDKNREIIEYQCEIVRLSKKVQKVLQEVITQSNKSQKTNSHHISKQQNLSKTIDRKRKFRDSNLEINHKCCQIIIKSKKKQKKTLMKSNKFNISIDRQEQKPKSYLSLSSSLNFSISKPFYKQSQICNKTVLSVQKIQQLEQKKISIEKSDLKQMNEAKMQAQAEQSDQKLSPSLNVSSRIHIQISSSGKLSSQLEEIDQNQIDLTLSESRPQISKASRKIQSKMAQIGQEQSQIISSSEAYAQTQCEQKETQSQTSQNFYQSIQQTYLKWIFDKDYEELQAKRKKTQSLEPQR